jgi:hypothetical protein
MATEGVSFRHFFLGLLDRRPMSGYDIKRLLERLKGLLGGSSFGNIYPAVPAHLSPRAPIMRLTLTRDTGLSGLMACLHQRRAHVVLHRDALIELSSQFGQADAGW